MGTLYYVQYTVRLTLYWDIILGHNIAISGPIGGPQTLMSSHVGVISDMLNVARLSVPLTDLCIELCQ